jgi:hypothetical protein
MSDSSARRDLHCYASDLSDFQKMADKLATLRQQLDYLNQAWKRVFEANAGLCEDPSGSHPEHVNHVVSSLGELREIKLLALLIGPAKFHGSWTPSVEQLAAERRFRHLVGLDVESKKES